LGLIQRESQGDRKLIASVVDIDRAFAPVGQFESLLNIRHGHLIAARCTFFASRDRIGDRECEMRVRLATVNFYFAAFGQELDAVVDGVLEQWLNCQARHLGAHW